MGRTDRSQRRGLSAAKPAGPGPGPLRPVVENVQPCVDSGRFPIKRVTGERVDVSADIHADGHEILAAVVKHRHESGDGWLESPMRDIGNDRWAAEFTVTRLGRHLYTVEAWIDRFATWRRDLEKRLAARLDVSAELPLGAALVEEAAARAEGPESATLAGWARRLREEGPAAQRAVLACSAGLLELMKRHPDRSGASATDRPLIVRVDRIRARCGAWYEMFPRSAASSPGRHGTFQDVEMRLPYVAGMGFDVLYLPPIHPIGRVHRKGANNALHVQPGDPGSPWAIGSAEGGHTAVHPCLGTLEDFTRLVAASREHGMEIAMDIAFQCAPDHPWVTEHPGWFRRRPDGTIRHAENPPKTYEDIVPFDFECGDWRALWDALRGVVLYWARQGIRIFRVDNPHTKPYAFWEETIAGVQEEFPDSIFLAEAFTRPKVMQRLAKLGFTQSYTYFAWRNTAAELRSYFTELRESGALEYFRPSLWPNTPDILTEHLQTGGRPAFAARLVLAATLGSAYGIYGPPFELMERHARGPGEEEYLDSEKYGVRWWDIDRPDSLRPLIAHVNRIRRDNPALHGDQWLRFHDVSHDQLVAYSKMTEDRSNIVLVVVNLDPHHRHAGRVRLPLASWGLEPARPFQAHDLLSDTRYLWQGDQAHVEIDPSIMPALILRLRRRVRSERDFDYYL